jgi:hypothetical protein
MEGHNGLETYQGKLYEESWGYQSVGYYTTGSLARGRGGV